MPYLHKFWDFLTTIASFLEAHNAVVTALSTVVIAAFTIALARATSGTLRHLRREFTTEHRPWLSVDVQPKADLLFLPSEGFFLIAEFVLTNTGRTPALDASCTGTIFFYPNSGKTPRQRQIDFATESLINMSPYVRPTLGLKDSELTYGRAIFPTGLPSTQRTRVNVSAEDLATWTRWVTDNPSSTDPEANLMLVGCVDYKSNLGVQYQTGFIYEIHRFVQTGVFIPVDPRPQRDVSIQFIPSRFGNGSTY